LISPVKRFIRPIEKKSVKQSDYHFLQTSAKRHTVLKAGCILFAALGFTNARIKPQSTTAVIASLKNNNINSLNPFNCQAYLLRHCVTENTNSS
jgi:hypothetical protein